MNRFVGALLGASALAFAMPAAAQTASLTFVIDGDTFSQPFTITNASDPGLNVVGFGITLISPFGFDTVENPPGVFGFNGAVPLTPNAAAAAATGYAGPAFVPEGSNSLAFTFSDFNPGEAFVWDIDVDSPTVATIFGSDLIGSTGYADFSNGLRGVGVFEAFGTEGSQFVITTFVPTPSVPEPASWAMMISGFGLLGGAMRRRAQVRSTKVSFAA